MEGFVATLVADDQVLVESSYDAAGRLVEQRWPGARVRRWTWGPQGELRSAEEGDRRWTWRWTFDRRGRWRRVAEAAPDGSTVVRVRRWSAEAPRRERVFAVDPAGARTPVADLRFVVAPGAGPGSGLWAGSGDWPAELEPPTADRRLPRAPPTRFPAFASCEWVVTGTPVPGFDPWSVPDVPHVPAVRPSCPEGEAPPGVDPMDEPSVPREPE